MSVILEKFQKFLDWCFKQDKANILHVLFGIIIIDIVSIIPFVKYFALIILLVIAYFKEVYDKKVTGRFDSKDILLTFIAGLFQQIIIWIL